MARYRSPPSRYSGEIRQIAAMQAYGHGVYNPVESMRPKLPLKFERRAARRPFTSRNWRQAGFFGRIRAPPSIWREAARSH